VIRVYEVERPDSYVYETWNEIAKAIGVSVRTAQSWHRRFGLPVLVGPTGRVRAYHGRIREWLRSHERELRRG
jgi:hypothetical protein